MSIGNLKDYGNKGNNFPFQLKVLNGLQAVVNSTGSTPDVLSVLNDILDVLQGSPRTPVILSSTTVGATPAGVYSISIANVGAAAGVVNGVSIPAGVTINYDGGGMQNTLTAMSYNATGTTFVITYIS
jgi:hypothetical protein